MANNIVMSPEEQNEHNSNMLDMITFASLLGKTLDVSSSPPSGKKNGEEGKIDCAAVLIVRGLVRGERRGNGTPHQSPPKNREEGGDICTQANDY